MNEIEIKFINKFIVQEKRARYIEFITKEKHRSKFTNKLAHFGDLIEDLFEDANTDPMHKIQDRIKALKKNITKCHVISEGQRLDKQIFEVDEELISKIGGMMGTILIFGDADFVFYKGEMPKNNWISKLC